MAQGATKPAQRQRHAEQIATAAQWAQAAFHVITCPSGARVKVRIPDMSMLMAGDALPEHLRVIAYKMATDDIGVLLKEKEGADGNGSAPELDPEILKAATELGEWLVLQTVVEPELTPEQVSALPTEDKEMLVSIAKRERDRDAFGVRLGVDPLSRWDTFRHEHECPEGCPACERARQVFSTAELGEM